MDKIVELTDFPTITQVVRDSLGGGSWKGWCRDYLLRYRMKIWADQIGENKVLDALKTAAVCEEGPMSFWDGVEYTLQAKYPHGHDEEHQPEGASGH